MQKFIYKGGPCIYTPATKHTHAHTYALHARTHNFLTWRPAYLDRCVPVICSVVWDCHGGRGGEGREGVEVERN